MGIPAPPADAPAALDPAAEEELTLVELVNRVLDRGVAVTGTVLIGVAGIDLVYLGLRLVLASVETVAADGDGAPPENGGT